MATKTFPEGGEALLTITRPTESVWLLSMHNLPDNRLSPFYLTKCLSPALDWIELQFWKEYHDGKKEASLVITGERTKHKFFSNGLDIERAQFESHFLPSMFYPMLRRILKFPMHTIAAINGHCFAGGFLISQCCDWRVMKSDRAWCCMNEIEFGASLTTGILGVLKHRFGTVELQRMLYEAHRYTSAEALTLGMVEEVVDGDGEAVIKRAVELADSKKKWSVSGALPWLKAGVAAEPLKALSSSDVTLGGGSPVEWNEIKWKTLEGNEKKKKGSKL